MTVDDSVVRSVAFCCSTCGRITCWAYVYVPKRVRVLRRDPADCQHCNAPLPAKITASLTEAAEVLKRITNPQGDPT